ncbi:MAG: ATP-binding cassette domain-containing protein [Magnetospirillum sp. WYHS-4]
MNELLQRLAARRGIVAEILAASFIINLLGFTSTIYVMQVMNRYIGFGVDATLMTLTVVAIIAVAFEAGFREARTRLARLIVREPNRVLAERTMETLLESRLAGLEKLPQSHRGEVMRGMDAVEQTYSATNLAALTDLPFALLFLGALFLLHPALGMVAFLASALQIAATLHNQMRLRDPTRQVADAQAEVNQSIAAAVGAADTVRAFLGAEFVKQRWGRDREVLSGRRETVGGLQGLVMTLSGMIGGLQGVAIICLGGILVVTGSLTAGAMIGANILAGRALQPISRFAAMLESISKANQAIRLAEDFGKLPRERREGTLPDRHAGHLELIDLAFSFPGAPMPLFESLSLKLAPGEVLLVVGTNGAGKTTLARLLVGLLEPQRGQILVDGIDLRQIDTGWWRRRIAYLPQEPSFLPGSIADNFKAIDPSLDQRRMTEVIAAAGLKAFVDGQARGLDTPIVDGGRTLAVGVRRRLALARALVNPSRLAILDEPTEGMDAEGTAALHKAVNALAAGGATLILFSHDPNAMKGATFVLDLGVKPVPRLTAVAQREKVPGDA